MCFVFFVQGFQALGDLPVFTVSHERFHTLSEFVIAQKDTLKDVSDQMKKHLFNKFEENLGKCDQFL